MSTGMNSTVPISFFQNNLTDLSTIMLVALCIAVGSAIGGSACWFYEKETADPDNKEGIFFYLTIGVAVTLSFFFFIGESNLLSLSFKNETLAMSLLRLISFSCICGLLGPVFIRPIRKKAADLLGVEVNFKKELNSTYNKSSGLTFVEAEKWYSGQQYYAPIVEDESYSDEDRNKARYHYSLCLLNIGIDRFMLTQELKPDDSSYSLLLRQAEKNMDEAVAQIGITLKAWDKEGIQYATALARKAYFGYEICRLNNTPDTNLIIKDYSNIKDFNKLVGQALDANQELAFYLREEYPPEFWDALNNKLKNRIYSILAGSN